MHDVERGRAPLYRAIVQLASTRWRDFAVL